MITDAAVGEPRLIVADMGFAQLSGSAYDVIVADARISWAAAVSGPDQPGTVVRSVPVPAGSVSTRSELASPAVASERWAPVSERAWPGAWRQIDRPWLASTTPGALVLLNQETAEQVTVPGSDVAATECAPDRCRVRVTSGGDSVRLELMAPDGSDRTAIAGRDTFFATVDPLALGRYELLSQTGGDLAPGQMRLLLHDVSTGTTNVVETGPRSQVNVRDGWAWWLAGEATAPVWHAVQLTAL